MRMYRIFNMNILKLLILGSIIFFLTLGVSVAYDVNGSDNINSNTNQESFADLNALIENLPENSNITLSQDYFSRNDDFPDGIVINKPITINGNNHIIDANSNSRIFDVSASGVVLKNIVFINGKTDGDGGAVRLAPDSEINNCTFENNRAGRGGAVYLDESYIYDSDFVNNSAAEGGAVYSDGGSTYSSTFTDNHADEAGGAIFQLDSSVSDSVFRNNSAGTSGGAVYQSDSILASCVFQDNNAATGGAIYQIASKLYDSVLSDNSADHGGAVYQESDSELHNCTFENNHAKFGCDDICDPYYPHNGDQSDDTTRNNSSDSQSDDIAQNNYLDNPSDDISQNKIGTAYGKNNTGNPLGLLMLVVFVLITRVKR